MHKESLVVTTVDWRQVSKNSTDESLAQTFLVAQVIHLDSPGVSHSYC